MSRLLVGLTLIALAIGGGVSLLASEAPDGLEHSMEAVGASDEGAPVLHSPMADYEVGFIGHPVARKVIAGVAGTLAVLGLVLVVGWLLTRTRRKPEPQEEGSSR